MALVSAHGPASALPTAAPRSQHPALALHCHHPPIQIPQLGPTLGSAHLATSIIMHVSILIIIIVIGDM